MFTLQEARVNAHRQVWLGIDDAVSVLMAEGGTLEVLKFLAFLAQGESIPAPIVLRLKQEAAKIVSAC
jgi:hypothetical protein